MACSPFIPEPVASTTSDEAGFATPAAVVISLALATIAVAVQLRAIAALHASQADYVRTGAELRLDGAQTQAQSDLASGQRVRNGAWSLPSDAGPVEARADPEGSKLSYAAASTLGAQTLAALGASHPGAVQAGLAQLAEKGDTDPSRIAMLDPSPVWRTCAGRLVSAYGQGVALGAPASASAVQARAGEVWRVRVRDGWGWTDERTVRFTGDAGPARVIYRSFHRSLSGDPRCPLAPPSPQPALTG